jgi:hypothetical protein
VAMVAQKRYSAWSRRQPGLGQTQEVFGDLSLWWVLIVGAFRIAQEGCEVVPGGEGAGVPGAEHAFLAQNRAGRRTRKQRPAADRQGHPPAAHQHYPQGDRPSRTGGASFWKVHRFVNIMTERCKAP